MRSSFSRLVTSYPVLHFENEFAVVNGLPNVLLTTLGLVTADVLDHVTLEETQPVRVDELDGLNGHPLVVVGAYLFLSGRQSAHVCDWFHVRLRFECLTATSA